MFRFRSLSSRFVLTSVVATVATLVLFIVTVAQKLDHSLARQSEELERLTDTNISRTLEADAHLATARLNFQFADIARRVEAIAMRADTLAAIESRNMVAVEAILAPAARTAEVNSVLAIDPLGNVIGASIHDADLVGLNQKLAASSWYGEIQRTLTQSRPDAVNRVSVLAPKSDIADFAGPDATHRVAQLVVVPVFDDFGEVAGGLVAQRWLKPGEPILDEFVKITGVGLAVYLGGEVISTAGISPDITFGPGKRLTAVAGGEELIARCAPAMTFLTMCAFKPLAEVYAAQNEATRIGRLEGSTLVKWLIGFGLISALVMSVAIAATALPITRPLRRLSKVVSAVARGEYDVAVEGTERADEIGEIATSVLVLRDSVRERDNLRANIVVKNATLERQESELRNQNLLFDAALNNMSHGLCMFNAEKRLIVSNARYAELFGLDRTKLQPGIPFSDLLALQTTASEEFGDADGARTDVDPLHWPADHRSSVTQRLADGRIILTTRQPLAGGGWVVIYEDVTERHKARDRLIHQAKHDGLTSLPNRIRLREHLIGRLEQVRSGVPGSFAVLCIDLDEFKTVNDTLGHPAGDLLLQQVADRLLRFVQEDHLVVRLGGDEFAIVTELQTAPEFAQIAHRLIEIIGESYDVDGHQVLIGASIGIAISPADSLDADELMKQADLALYRAKSEGRNTFCFFKSEMAESVRERQDLISDLRGALESGGLSVYFQPQIDLSDDSVAGFEALVRWSHPTHGMIPPNKFIPIAEETGLIVPMGEWILRESCRHAADWPLPVRVAVNISARQLRDKGFVSVVLNALAATGLPATRLELEITESVLLQDDEETRSILLQLKSLGIAVAMDDFGTGYSSLSCLRNFPFDKIKIDQSFVRAMFDSEEASSIVTAIIELAGNLKVLTTAEGIEGQAQLDLLKAKGCREGQGYLLGRPEPAEAAVELLRNRQSWTPKVSSRRRRA